MTSRKKPGVAFWATAGLAIYLASFVALIGLDARLLPASIVNWLRTIYSPIIWLLSQFR